MMIIRGAQHEFRFGYEIAWHGFSAHFGWYSFIILWGKEK